jgi:phosphoribosylformylglycinamidine (FGAM) synthase-like enzyme
MIYRIAVAPKGKKASVIKIYYLETSGKINNPEILHNLFCNPETEEIVETMPKGRFLERMYTNAVIDPAQESIIIACQSLGIEVEAVKVSHRYYGRARKKVFVNKLVHMSFTKEPVLETLKPRGLRKGMQTFDLRKMTDKELLKLSVDMELALSLAQMKKLIDIQRRLKLPVVTDVFLETFAARWSDHCFHTKWKALGLFKLLQSATERINNPNLISAFEDNAGGWKFYDGLVAALKLETHNSPTQMEPYGGQMTKIGGVLRDIYGFGLGALPIGSLEMTTVGEFDPQKFPGLKGRTLSAKTIAMETIRAIRDYTNPMGIPMSLARMNSHPNFGGKTFALGGTFGITTMAAAKKGKPRIGDLAILVGGDTGNDGIHGATVSSGELTEKTDTGDACHVQIGSPYTEQKFTRASIELRDAGCLSATNDFGAAGIISAVGEMGESTGKKGGVLVNLAAVPLKTAGLENWQIALSESQERMAYAIKPEKYTVAMKIFRRYQLKATVIGIFTGNGNLQLIYNKSVKKYHPKMKLTGEIALDVPYACFENCPLPKIKVIAPPAEKKMVVYPKITAGNVEEMAIKVVSHFDVCNQALATTQYDSTVQGKTWQGPLYGKDYNIATHLAVSRPVYGKDYGITVSWSFDPWQFEIDPVGAAVNAVLDAVATQVVAGVKLENICLADNFYTPNLNPYAYWYLQEQVRMIAHFSKKLGTPFITGKDSSSGSAYFKDINLTVNVLPSVAITAMGKIRDVKKLVPHQWQSDGNLLFSLGPEAMSLDGSILSSALGITGNKLDTKPVKDTKLYMKCLAGLAEYGIFKSAVPINRGGIILRLFEGAEASGLGVSVVGCSSLFPESFGGVLVEVDRIGADILFRGAFAKHLSPTYVGLLLSEKKLEVDGKALNLKKLFNVWNKKFRKEVMAA